MARRSSGGRSRKRDAVVGVALCSILRAGGMSRERGTVGCLVLHSSLWVFEFTKFFDMVAIANAELVASAAAMLHITATA